MAVTGCGGSGSTPRGLRFEVTDKTSGQDHATQAAFPLYAGRWYHLAATMKTWSTRTNLSLFVNGQLVAWKNESSYTVKSTNNNALLYLGRDQATALALFKGIADEFRLYKTALTPDSVKGLLWFLKGSNNVLIPRGVFYDSKLYGKLNGAFDGSSPFAGATAYGNSNTLSSNLNGRVIQMVIAKNLTLVQAWGILDLARVQNGTGNVTAFPFFATSEFYTLGFAWEVSKLAPNASVANSGNSSMPAPPASQWQLFWNTVAGWAERVWNAAVAVGAFFANVGKWLVQAALAYVKGLTTGNWTDFKERVLDPLVKAIQAALDFIMKLITAAISVIFRPLLDAFDAWQREAVRRFTEFAMALRGSGSLSTPQSPRAQPPALGTRGERFPRVNQNEGLLGTAPPWAQFLVSLLEWIFLFSSVAVVLLAIGVAIEVFEIGIKLASGGLVAALAPVITKVIITTISTIVTGIVIAHFLNLLFSGLLDLVPNPIEDVAFGAVSLADIAIAVMLWLAKNRGVSKSVPFINTAESFRFALLSLWLLTLSTIIVGLVVPSLERGLSPNGLFVNFMKMVIDFVAVIGAALALDRLEKDKSLAKNAVDITYAAVTIIDVTSMVLSVGSFTIDAMDMLAALREQTP